MVVATKSLTPQLSGDGGYGQPACLDRRLALQRRVKQAQAPWRAWGLAKLRPQVPSLEPTWPQQQLSELS